jgi:predicted Zn-dependent peptidase
MQDLAELERRIAAALHRIGEGIEDVTFAAASPSEPQAEEQIATAPADAERIQQLQDALSAERHTVAELREQLEAQAEQAPLSPATADEDRVELLARMMRPAIRADDFTTEKLVILEEIRMYDDQPPFGADERCRAAFFGGHPLFRSVLGTVESIEALPVEAMRDYHARRYAPNRMVLAASGAIDFPALVADARRWCGQWTPQPDAPRLVAAQPRAAAEPEVHHIERPAATLAYAVKAAAGPAETHADRFAAKLLATVLGDSSGSRLYWEFVDSGAAEQATLHHQEFLDAGLFVTQVSCDAEEAETLLERIASVYTQAIRDGLSREEFEQARNKLAARVVLAGERPRRRLFEVGGEWAHSGIYRTVAESLAIVESLTRDDLHRVLETWPLDAPAATVIAGPPA